jgi:hypothetical protein
MSIVMLDFQVVMPRAGCNQNIMRWSSFAGSAAAVGKLIGFSQTSRFISSSGSLFRYSRNIFLSDSLPTPAHNSSLTMGHHAASPAHNNSLTRIRTDGSPLRLI